MSVSVQCTTCKITLELDDGFRGGVCRCSNCGSLLQVPRSADEGVAKSRPAGPAGMMGPGRSDDSGARSADSGMSDPLSDGMGGSGSSSSGLRHPRPVPTARTAPRKRTTSSSSRESQQGSTGPSLPVSMPSRPVRPTRQIKKNNVMLLMGIGFGIIIAAAIITIVAMYVLR